MEKKTKDELVQWGLAIGATHAMKSFSQYAERRLMEKKLEELGEEEFKVWVKNYREEEERNATMVFTTLKYIAIATISFILIQGMLTGFQH